MKLILAASLIGTVAALTACDRSPSSTTTNDTTNTNRDATNRDSTNPNSSTTSSSEARARERAQQTKPVEPDNTGKNTRDRDGTNTTPTDAGQSSSDVKIAADIRSSVMKISGLSTSGQNCKIVVKDGAVTLRGPVATADEKSQIAAAGACNGGRHQRGRPVGSEQAVTRSMIERSESLSNLAPTSTPKENVHVSSVLHRPNRDPGHHHRRSAAGRGLREQRHFRPFARQGRHPRLRA